jgi:hypothetical protein
VKRRVVILLICLLISLAFAGWQWLRPYEWDSDPAARFKVAQASITRDHSYLWLDLYLKHHGTQQHDLTQPIALILLDGRKIEPADTTLEGDDSHPTRALGLRFWLEEKDLPGPLCLQLNGTTLSIRTGTDLPRVGDGASRYFNTQNW